MVVPQGRTGSDSAASAREVTRPPTTRGQEGGNEVSELTPEQKEALDTAAEYAEDLLVTVDELLLRQVGHRTTLKALQDALVAFVEEYATEQEQPDASER